LKYLVQDYSVNEPTKPDSKQNRRDSCGLVITAFISATNQWIVINLEHGALLNLDRLPGQ
jgi:hypothetical protein